MTEPDEVRRLRERVSELETELAARRQQVTGELARRRFSWRAVVSALLITFACLLAPLSVTAVWASRQVSDTDRYLETVAPLADDPAVQRTISDAVSNAILDAVDFQSIATETLDAVAQQGVPPRVAANLHALSGPLVNGIENFVRSQVDKLVASPQFAAVWRQANETAHASLVNLLDGNQGGALSAQNDTVTLNLAPIIAEVKQRMVAGGFGLADKIPVVNKSIVLVQSDGVTKAQGLYRLLNTLGTWLPVIALVLLVSGVFVARDRRRALLKGSLGFAGAMLVLGVALTLARVFYLNALPSEVLSRDAGGVVFDTIVRFLRYGLRAVGVLALIVALAAYFTGPSNAAVQARAKLAGGIGSLRGRAEAAGLNTGRVGGWTFAHKRLLLIASVVGGALVLTLWSRPTVTVVVVTAVVVLFVVALIEFIGRPPVTAGGDPPSAPA
ncbi:hypothetical protein [Kribbella jiaozuonensis]|uniref:Integral membrane protein n=1 Tax=Kribbella jiaozuonensis TaxID=2575441 RepID=A0A4U3LZB3_9ACTN|nr:hypothetical protein [Kribbella jiaozuonensis]TKK80177.1 hypothetical protein FDA38_17760 [Kribbella jiaozuonensis]